MFDVGYVVIHFHDHFPWDLHECGPRRPGPALEQPGAGWMSKVGRAGPKPHRASNGMERAFPLLDCTSLLSAASRPLSSSIPRPAWQRGRLGEQLLLPRPTELPLGRAQPHVTYSSRCFRLATSLRRWTRPTSSRIPLEKRHVSRTYIQRVG